MSAPGYLLPRPDTTGERARLDIQHDLSLLVYHGSLLLSEFPPSNSPGNSTEARPLRVADLGTGTGSWAIDFARRHPSAQVVGFDLNPSPPYDIPLPANLHFVVHDVHNPWPIEGPAAGSFDLVHGRQVLINLQDPYAALRHAWSNLRPGGTVEFHESWNPLVSEWETEKGEGNECNKDGSTSTNRQEVPLLVEWHRGTVVGSARMGCDAGFGAQLPAALESTGFVDVKVHDSKIPLGIWTIDNAIRDERVCKMGELLRVMLKAAVPSMSIFFSQGLGWSEERTAAYAARVLEELDREDLADHRIYARSRNVRAKKPVCLK
ncbi:S-adenosyl-L-methionine-dependent methyltransferase [Xylaria sp. FL1777]|nr:S-adenosyl-L-methionine-dependent methyltransferase [Xylaria sp. FL1777]